CNSPTSASRSCRSGAARRCSPAMRLATAAATGRSTQNVPPKKKNATTASSTLTVGASPRRGEAIRLAPLRQQPLREIHALGEVTHFLPQVLHLGRERFPVLGELGADV